MWKIVEKSCKDYDLSVINFKLALHLKVFCKEDYSWFHLQHSWTSFKLYSLHYWLNLPSARTYRNAYQAAGFAKKIGGYYFRINFFEYSFFTWYLFRFISFLHWVSWRERTNKWAARAITNVSGLGTASTLSPLQFKWMKSL